MILRKQADPEQSKLRDDEIIEYCGTPIPYKTELLSELINLLRKEACLTLKDKGIKRGIVEIRTNQGCHVGVTGPKITWYFNNLIDNTNYFEAKAESGFENNDLGCFSCVARYSI